MTERDQLRRVCQWNGQLARENARLRKQLQRVHVTMSELEAANADLRVEAEAADAFLGTAIDAAIEADRR